AADLGIPCFGSTAPGAVSVLLGDGTGRLGSPGVFGLESNPQSLAAADVDGDGHLDVVAADTTIGVADGDTVSVLLGDGTGALGAAARFKVGSYPRPVVAADWNGDGKTDVATADGDGNTISLLIGAGDGTFPTRSALPLPRAQFVVPGDLDAD